MNTPVKHECKQPRPQQHCIYANQLDSWPLVRSTLCEVGSATTAISVLPAQRPRVGFSFLQKHLTLSHCFLKAIPLCRSKVTRRFSRNGDDYVSTVACHRHLFYSAALSHHPVSRLEIPVSYHHFKMARPHCSLTPHSPSGEASPACH